MRVCLLGSGAADGWPNAFCACPACQSARRDHVLRGQTSALIDDVMIVDCGPQAPFQATRLGESLTGVRVLLYTHAHSDHFGPEALLYRSWADPKPLQVLGPPSVIQACEPWLAPTSSVELVEMHTGQTVELAGYEVTALPAAHRVFEAGDSFLFDITGPDGARILWASDTGPLPSTWFAQVTGAHYDLVFLEHTFGEYDLGGNHLNADGFAHTVTELRACSAVDDRTQVIAVHLGHHNGNERLLRERLALSGAHAGTDGLSVFAGVSSRSKRSRKSTLES